MLLDKLAEEGQVGKIEFGADFLNRLVAIAQLLANSATVVSCIKSRGERPDSPFKYMFCTLAKSVYPPEGVYDKATQIKSLGSRVHRCVHAAIVTAGWVNS